MGRFFGPPRFGFRANWDMVSSFAVPSSWYVDASYRKNPRTPTDKTPTDMPNHAADLYMALSVLERL